MADAFVAREDFRIGAGVEKDVHHLQVVGGGGEQERRRSLGVQVSAREVRLRHGHARVHIRAVGQQGLHQPQFGLAIRNAGHGVVKTVHRIRGEAFPLAGRPVQRREAARLSCWDRRHDPAATARLSTWPRTTATSKGV